MDAASARTANEDGALVAVLAFRPMRAYPVLMAKAEHPEPTPFQRFEDALRKVISVPKKDVDKAATREKKAREARRTDQPK